MSSPSLYRQINRCSCPENREMSFASLKTPSSKGNPRRNLKDTALGFLLLCDLRSGVEHGSAILLAHGAGGDKELVADRMASSNTLFRFRWVSAEHSRYL